VIAAAYPDLEITALARNSDKGAKIVAKHPRIKLVYGDLDSTDMLTAETAKADIVVHTAHSDHVGAANAIVSGLAQKTTPGYLIHTSGTGLMGFEDHERKTYGEYVDTTYDDWEGLPKILSLPEHYLHNDVNKIVLAAAKKNPGNVFTAIVCPPTIYGPGRGPDNQRSVQGPDMANAVLKRGKGFQLGEGKNIWTEVHVQDLSEVFLALVAAALEGGGKATWNDEGFYFTENGEFMWGEVAQKIAKIAADMKLIETTELDSVDWKAADEMREFGAYLWGTNARCKSIRANRLFGWTPKKEKLFDTLPAMVEGEAKALGLVKGHAEKAAGDA
jgi:nucleoside-diphosphate-sugar epimerase